MLVLAVKDCLLIMKIFGIHFAPLFVPLHRRLETLSAFTVMFLFTHFALLSTCITIALMFTKVWWIMVLYFIWIIFDRETSERGERQNKWVQSWKIFKWARNYYPISVTTVPGLKLNPEKNYIACTFPHGQFPVGVLLGFAANTLEKQKVLSHHSLHGATLAILHCLPFYREIIQAFGFCCAKKESINYILQTPGGGKVVAITPGGAKESQYAHRDKYFLVLKNRKGFIKLALQNGSSLLPLFSFGETSLYKQHLFPNGSLLGKFQKWFRDLTGISLNAVQGRGFFQYTFGIGPFRKPIGVVVGLPIDVEKNKDPTQEDIDALHKKFINVLMNLFEDYKYKFEKNPGSASIVII